MLFRTLQMLREFPVTWLLLFGCPVLWVLCHALSNSLNIPYEAACSMLGGPHSIALWNGEWWRIVVSKFHHGGLIHLLCNMTAVAILGRPLETKLGSYQYAAFCGGALAVSSAVQEFWGPSVGVSGLAFAQFGLICGLRLTDKWWQARIPGQLIQSGLVVFFACFVIDWLGIVPIANVAHAVGLGYGWLVARIKFGSPRARHWWPVFVFSHVFLVPCLYLLTHPLWDGNYHWHLGDVARNPIEKLHHYQNAVRCDPDLEGPWLNLGRLHRQHGDPEEAWRCVLNGLSRHPSSQTAIELARALSRDFIGPQKRSLARQILHETFRDRSDAWEKLLFDVVPLEELPALIIGSDKQPLKAPAEPQRQVEEQEPPELPTTLPRRALDEIVRPESKLPPPDPAAPGSAEEGRAA